MSSIGYFSSIGGSGGQASKAVINKQNPGGAIRGYMPQQNQTVDKQFSEFEHIRFTLKQAWNTTYPSQLKANKLKQSIITPFRAVNNAGDLLSRQNYSCGGTCQTYQSRPGLHGLRQRFGAISDSCQADVFWSPVQIDPKVPASACNTKYVYDSSDYIRFLKNQAVNKNYNDRSFGGNDSSAQQSKWRSVRRY